MSFADNLQRLRRRDRITQEELAERLGVSRQSVSKWETGEAYPETEKIIKLCGLFSVGMDELMRGDIDAEAEPLSDAPHSAAECPADLSAPDPDGQKKLRLRTIGGAVSGGLMLCAAAVYICLGAVLNLWHPAWLVFLLAFTLCVFVDNVFAKEDDDDEAAAPLQPLAVRILGGLGNMIMPLAVTIYLFIGCVRGLWHPSWIIFIIAAVLTAAVHGIAAAVGGRE